MGYKALVETVHLGSWIHTGKESRDLLDVVVGGLGLVLLVHVDPFLPVFDVPFLSRECSCQQFRTIRLMEIFIDSGGCRRYGSWRGLLCSELVRLI